MYKIDLMGNQIEKLPERTFGELSLKEREHLQEWIAKNPCALGEELLIIQKEFAGFSDTLERLDLLAVDKQGSLVIIENKLDDTGRDVTWQALKYASYCSSLSKEHIRNIYQNYLDKNNPGSNAEEKLSEFFDSTDYEYLNLNIGVTQRIILIAAKFRKEVTSTVLWLLNFKIRLQCFRVTPYSMGEDLFLKIDQIIPTQDAEEYMIKMAEKSQDDIHSQQNKMVRESILEEFWNRIIHDMNKTNSQLYQNVHPGNRPDIVAKSGVSNIYLNFCVTKKCARAELYIKGSKKENEEIYDYLHAQKDQLEKDFGCPLVWERLDDRNACRIKTEIAGNIYDKAQWDVMIPSMVNSMLKLESAFRNPLKMVNLKFKRNSHEEGDNDVTNI